MMAAKGSVRRAGQVQETPGAEPTLCPPSGRYRKRLSPSLTGDALQSIANQGCSWSRGDGSSLGPAPQAGGTRPQVHRGVHIRKDIQGPEVTSQELGTKVRPQGTVNRAHLSISSPSKTGDQGPGCEITVKSYSGTSVTRLLLFPCPGYQERLIHNLKAQRRQNGERAGGGQTL